MNISTDTYFKIFKIKKISSISPDELKRRYRILAMKYHPDHGGTNLQFRLINDAYEYLKERMIEFIKMNDQKFFDNKKYIFYGDGSAYDIEKGRWARLKDSNGKWIIYKYKYLG